MPKVNKIDTVETTEKPKLKAEEEEEELISRRRKNNIKCL